MCAARGMGGRSASCCQAGRPAVRLRLAHPTSSFDRRREEVGGRCGAERVQPDPPFTAFPCRAGSGSSVHRVASGLLVPQRGQGHGAFLGSECRAAGRRGSRFVWGLAHHRGRGTVKLAVARSLTPLPPGPSAQRASVRGDTGRPPCAVAVGLDAGVPPPPASNRVTCPGQQPGSRGAATLAVLSMRPVPGDLHAAAARDLRPAFRPSSLPRRPRWVGGQGGGGPCREPCLSGRDVCPAPQPGHRDRGV